MSTVYTSTAHLLGHGPNQSFGNHIMHLFYIWNLSKTRGFDMGITSDSNLDNLLELSKYKKKLPTDAKCLYDELFGGQYEEFHRKEVQNGKVLHNLLYEPNLQFPENFYIKGWFWNEQLSPSETIFEDLKIKTNLLDYVNSKYGYIKNENTLTIHYRGTDFRNHSIGWGDLSLPKEYYISSYEHLRNLFDIKKILIVSDEPQFLFDTFKGYSVEVEISNEQYYIDWLILQQSRNLICSNSSFCWSAGLFNKTFVTQPRGFFMYKINKDLTFPPNPYYKNSIII